MSGEAYAEATAEALGLLRSITGLLSKTRESAPQLAASVVVQRLPGETFRAAQRLAADLREWRRDMEAVGVDLGRNLNELQEEYDWWHYRRFRSVRNFRQRLAGLNGSLALLLDDMVAVALCFKAEELLVQCHRDATAQRQAIREMIDPNRPVQEILKEAEVLVEGFVTQLGDMQ